MAAKKSDLKTRVNKKSVSGFLSSIKNEERRQDAKTILTEMKKISGKTPKMWGKALLVLVSITINMHQDAKGTG